MKALSAGGFVLLAVLHPDAAWAQPQQPCPSAESLGSTILERIPGFPDDCKERLYQQVIDVGQEPAASLSRSNLATLLLTRKDTAAYKKAASIVSKIDLPTPGVPDKLFNTNERLQLRLTMAHVYDFADMQDEALAAYQGFLRDGGDAAPILQEMVFCSGRYLRSAATTGVENIMHIALILEMRSSDGLGQEYLRALWSDAGTAKSLVEHLIIRLYVLYPPLPEVFQKVHQPQLLNLLKADSCTRGNSSLLCDVLRAFCGSLKCGATPRRAPYGSPEEVTADFPAAAVFAERGRKPLVVDSKERITNPAEISAQFVDLELRLAGSYAVKEPIKAMVLSTAAWFLSQKSTRAGRRVAALIHDNAAAVDPGGKIKATLVAYYAPESSRINFAGWFRQKTPQRVQATDLENLLDIYHNLDVNGVKNIESQVSQLVAEISTLMPEGLEELANSLPSESNELKTRVLRLAQAQYLAVDAEKDAVRVAKSLADLDPELRHRANVYEGQQSIVGAVPKGLRGQNTEVLIHTRDEPDPCRTAANAQTGVYVCPLAKPLGNLDRVTTSVSGAPGSAPFKFSQLSLSARVEKGVSLPKEGDHYIEGWLRSKNSASLVKINVMPPACSKTPVSATEADAILRPGETFFSVPLQRALIAGETVSVSTWDAVQPLAKLTVRPEDYDPEDSRSRIYSRIGVAQVRPSSGGTLMTPVLGLNMDWALTASSVPPAGCEAKSRDFFSFHAYFDFGYDRIAFIHAADRSLFTKFGIPMELGFYAPMPLPRGRWRSQDRVYSLFFAPLVRAGINFNVEPPPDAMSSGHWHSLYAGGIRLGMQRHTGRVPGLPATNDYLISFVDMSVGRFSSLALLGSDKTSRTPWRADARATFMIPGTKLFLGGRVNFGGGLPSDVRLELGYRPEFTQLLAKTARQWF